MSKPIDTLSAHDHIDLQHAHALLENPSIAAKLSNVIGAPVEQSMKMLPDKWSQRIHSVTAISIDKALDVAVESIPKRPQRMLPHKFYTGAAISIGAASGFIGLPALAFELPLSTTLLLRAIADVALQEGESLDDLESRLACMEVFALGGISPDDDAAETGYYGTRLALSMSLNQAVQYISTHGLSQRGAPVLVNFVSAVASRFGVAISQKTALQLLPVAGALGGATINGLFMEHFKNMAHGHFTLRRLERKYGEALVQKEYLIL
ncbi:MAG: EcsC family protein [Gammaproteobacteria bacterium]|nr:EcsC family protein [Gammaproteobacteria bacterium]